MIRETARKGSAGSGVRSPELLAVAALALAVVGGAPAATDEHAERRKALVETVRAQGIADEKVLEAIGAVPRHEFVPEEIRAWAYLDRPLPIGHDQTISQPYIVALMTELLRVRKGQRILEVGTGSGYQAAVLAHLGAEVHSIEIVPELAARAARDLERLGYAKARVYEGDGFLGRPDASPFDGVIITCAVDEVPPPLVGQLKTGGRIVLPLGDSLNYQDLTVVTKRKNGKLERRAVTGVIFVPMTGPHGHGRWRKREARSGEDEPPR